MNGMQRKAEDAMRFACPPQPAISSRTEMLMRNLAAKALADSLTLAQLYSATVRELATREEQDRFIAEWNRIRNS